MISQNKKKVSFEDLTLLYLNYSCIIKEDRISQAIKDLVVRNEESHQDIKIHVSEIQSIMSTSAEAVDQIDSELYIKELQESLSFKEDSMSLTQFLNDFLCVTKK